MRRTFRKGVIGATLLAAVTLAACGSGGDAAQEGPAISIGAQNFGESAILAEIYAQALAANGYEVSVQPLGGFRDIVLGSFESGDINFTPEYAASMLEYLNEQAGEATGDAAETTETLQGQGKPNPLPDQRLRRRPRRPRPTAQVSDRRAEGERRLAPDWNQPVPTGPCLWSTGPFTPTPGR